MLPQLAATAEQIQSRWTQRYEEISGSSVADLPSLGALGQTVALDLEAPWGGNVGGRRARDSRNKSRPSRSSSG